MKARYVTAWVDGGFRAALMFEGRDLCHFVIQTPKVVVRSRAKSEVRINDAQPSLMTAAQAARRFRGSARRNGSTKEARRLLAGVGK